MPREKKLPVRCRSQQATTLPWTLKETGFQDYFFQQLCQKAFMNFSSSTFFKVQWTIYRSFVILGLLLLLLLLFSFKRCLFQVQQFTLTTRSDLRVTSPYYTQSNIVLHTGNENTSTYQVGVFILIWHGIFTTNLQENL